MKFQEKKPLVLGLIGLSLLVFGMVTGSILLYQNQDVRQQAASSAGSATISLVADQQLQPLSQANLMLTVANLDGSNIDGLQAIFEISFSEGVPSDFQFEQAEINGLRAAGTQVLDITNGKRILIGFITENPEEPVALNDNITLGILSFTVPASGEVAVEFDQDRTSILQHSTGSELAALPAPQSLAIALTPTPTPETEPENTSDTDDEATPTPTVTPTPTPTATTSPAPSPTPNSNPSALGGTNTTQSPTPIVLAEQELAVKSLDLPEELPESGSNSVLVLSVAGLVLIGLGLVWYRISGR